jgi:putative hemolysin
VLPAYRDGKTIELLWRGLWRYVRGHGVDLLFGCASLDGVDPGQASEALSYLHHHAAAPREWALSAVPSRYLPMSRVSSEKLDARVAFQALPPLLKAYLRLGARCGDGAVLDRAFGVIDVVIVMRVEDVSARHVRFYESKSREPQR